MQKETDADQRARGDNLAMGVGMGCLIQLGFLAAGFLIYNFAQKAGLSVYALSGWGLTQWLGIVPLAFMQRAKKRPRVVQGLILIGCLGLLLSSTCAWMLGR